MSNGKVKVRASREECIKAVRALIKHGPEDEHFGVCYNLSQQLCWNFCGTWCDEYGGYDGYRLTAAVAWLWPHTLWVEEDSGMRAPRPSFVPHNADTGLWGGVNFCMRQNLLQFMLAWLEAGAAGVEFEFEFEEEDEY